MSERRSVPNRPKARTDAEPVIIDEQRRRLLGASFAEQQSVVEAQEYDAVRPRYPQQAVDDILALAAAAADPGVEWAISGGKSEPGADIPPLNAHSGWADGASGRGGPHAGRAAGVRAEGAAAADPRHDAQPRIVDLGAGTGILSRQLLQAGARVHAVEPSAAMTQVLSHAAGAWNEQLTITLARAEETGLPRGQADVAVAAQAWHWFDAEGVQTEIASLLAPGGALALIWNYLDTADPTVHRLTRIMRAGDTYRPGWRPTLDEQVFTPLRTTEYRWTRTLTAAELFRYATTLSSWLSAAEDERARRRANLEDFLHRELGLSSDAPVQLPQITALHTARLQP